MVFLVLINITFKIIFFIHTELLQNRFLPVLDTILWILITGINTVKNFDAVAICIIEWMFVFGKLKENFKNKEVYSFVILHFLITNFK